MKEEGEKKRGLLLIARILRERTDADHPLAQQDILNILAEEYDVHIDRKSVRRNLTALMEAGWPVRCFEKERTLRGKPASMATGWYWQALLGEDDARLLFHLLYFCPLTTKARKDLFDVFSGVVGPYTDVRRVDVAGLSDPARTEAMLAQRDTVLALSAAMRKRVKIGFLYCHYGPDGELHPDTNADGEPKRFLVHPFRILAAGGRYMLLANDDGTENLRIYHVPLMADVRATEEPRRAIRSMKSLPFGVRPEEHVTCGVTFYEGSPELCTLEIDPSALTAFMLAFGKDIRIESAGESRIRIEVTAPPKRVLAWALVYGDRARVTSPAALVRRAKDVAQAAARQYEYS